MLIYKKDNNMDNVMANNQSRIMTDNDLKRFLQSKNVFEMSVDKLNYYFDSFYEFIMSDAVYPHLDLQN